MAGRSFGKKRGFYQKVEQIGCVAGARAFSVLARKNTNPRLVRRWRIIRERWLRSEAPLV